MQPLLIASYTDQYLHACLLAFAPAQCKSAATVLHLRSQVGFCTGKLVTEVEKMLEDLQAVFFGALPALLKRLETSFMPLWCALCDMVSPLCRPLPGVDDLCAQREWHKLTCSACQILSRQAFLSVLGSLSASRHAECTGRCHPAPLRCATRPSSACV